VIFEVEQMHKQFEEPLQKLMQKERNNNGQHCNKRLQSQGICGMMVA